MALWIQTVIKWIFIHLFQYSIASFPQSWERSAPGSWRQYQLTILPTMQAQPINPLKQNRSVTLYQITFNSKNVHLDHLKKISLLDSMALSHWQYKSFWWCCPASKKMVLTSILDLRAKARVSEKCIERDFCSHFGSSENFICS